MQSFLFARQRSGTGALGTVMGKHPALRYLGEVLHPDDRVNPLNFFRFLDEAPEQARAFADPNRREAVLEAYGRMLAAKFPNITTMIDIKYRSLHHWNGGWQGLNEAPWIIRYGREKGLPVLHLKRSNLIETFVSGRLADANRVWHAKDMSAVKITTTAVNLRELSSYLVSTTEEVDMIDRWLRGYPKLLTVEYGELFEAEGSINTRIAGQLSQLLGVEEFTRLQPDFKKQAPPRLQDSIENYDLVQRGLSGTEFEWMLTSSLPRKKAS